MNHYPHQDEILKFLRETVGKNAFRIDTDPVKRPPIFVTTSPTFRNRSLADKIFLSGMSSKAETSLSVMRHEFLKHRRVPFDIEIRDELLDNPFIPKMERILQNMLYGPQLSKVAEAVGHTKLESVVKLSDLMRSIEDVMSTRYRFAARKRDGHYILNWERMSL